MTFTTWWTRKPVSPDTFSRTVRDDQSCSLKVTDVCAGGAAAFGGLRLDSLPTAGVLRLDGQAVKVGQWISRAQIESGQLCFVPSVTLSGGHSSSFEYSLRSPSGGIDTCHRLNFDVCPSGAAPVAHDDVARTAAGTAVTIDVKANDTDADNARADLKVVQASLADPRQGTVSINADGTLLFKPAVGVSGVIELAYTVKDPAGHTDTAKVSVTVDAPSPTSCLTFDFSGCGGAVGAMGNVRTFTMGSVSVHASAFARDDATGAWSKAWLGSYSDGLGVTNRSGSGCQSDSAQIDNQGGQHDYVLLEFSQKVTLDKAFLSHVGCDSDLQVWVGNVSGAFNQHLALSDAMLKSLGFTEVSATSLTVAHWADLNAGQVSGNVIVIAANTQGGDHNDAFNLQKLVLCSAAGETPPPPVNHAPTLAAALIGASVSEEGLPKGIADNDAAPGASDTTNATVASGSLGASDIDGNALNYTLSAPTAALTSDGAAITWSGAGTATLTGSANGHDVLRVSVDASGQYQVALLGAVDHPSTGGEDTLSLDIGLVVSDGQAATNGTLRIAIEDDSPSASYVQQTMPRGSVDTNLLLVLDVSGSMALSSGVVDATTGATLTRLQLEQRALHALLDKYDAMGDVHVRLVTFSSDAQAIADPATGAQVWVNSTTARAQIDAITVGGWTNYDAALTTAMSAYVSPGASASSSAQSVVYFLSDGDPTAADTGPVGDPSTNPDIGIQAGEQATWQAFLAQHGMASFALGVGTDVTAVNLDPIAYDGLHLQDTNAVVVTDLAQLSNVLTGTVVAVAAGLLTTGDVKGGGFGADGGHVQSVTVDGTTYVFDAASGQVSGLTGGASFDATTHVLQLTTHQGSQLSIDFDDASYRYAITGTGAAAQDQIGYQLIDNDGDRVQGQLTLALHGAPLVGTAMADVFHWGLANAGSEGSPTSTSVTQFGTTAGNHDVLDLRDLLQGETASTLGNFLSFEGTAGGTVLHVSSHGQFAGGQFDAAHEDTRITLTDLDLAAALGTPGATSAQLIDTLLRQGQLQVGG